MFLYAIAGVIYINPQADAKALRIGICSFITISITRVRILGLRTYCRLSATQIEAGVFLQSATSPSPAPVLFIVEFVKRIYRNYQNVKKAYHEKMTSINCKK